jgi:hypothetical protein
MTATQGAREGALRPKTPSAIRARLDAIRL